jgi:zinc D-Ala-D-Ala carboxypeptidase
MQLTSHFTLEEMLESQTARRWNIQEQFNPPDEVVQNLKLLCVNILEPLRKYINRPIVISSGYRCAEVNKRVGGQPTSQHIKGQAADIHCVGISNSILFKDIKDIDLPYSQLIWEFGTIKEPAWVHVSYDGTTRHQVFSIGV